MPGFKVFEVQNVLSREFWIQAEMQCAIRSQIQTFQLPEDVWIDAVGFAAGRRLELLNLDQHQSGHCWQRSIPRRFKDHQLRDLVFQPGAVDACVMTLFEALLLGSA